MNKSLDDLEAVRTLVQTLEKFNGEDQERIIRWAREKLGLTAAVTTPAVTPAATKREPNREPLGPTMDIKAFVAAKNPTSHNQLAATVAYYYRFEAPEIDRKESITAKDLQDACRKAGRSRLKNPPQTLLNAHHVGLLDKAERGAYSINSVGENLVAMTLPGKKTEPRQKKKSRVKKALSKKIKKRKKNKNE